MKHRVNIPGVHYPVGAEPPRPVKDTIPADLRWEVWERDNFTCRRCGVRRHLTADHIHPESQGGETALHNLQTLCKSCNSRKGVRVESEWS